MDSMNSDIISQAIVKLFESERFYAEIISQMTRIVSKRVPTAGVCIKDRIELHINPDFFEKISPTERVAVLKHECEHILRDHVGRAKELAPDVYQKDSNDVDRLMNKMKHQSLNIAADCAINGALKGLSEDCIFPKDFGLPDGQTFEWYHNALKDNDKAKEFMDFDDHSLWAESESDKEILKEKIRQAIEKAAQKTRATGKMTAEDELLVSTLLHKPKDWKADLKRFAAKNIEALTESSRKKRNRRYGIQYPGIVKLERLHIGVAIDTSGSISDEALTQFMTEIGNIAKYAMITVVEVDAEIKNSYVFDPKKQYTVSGRGGTAYQPAFDFFNKDNEIDGMIYFGDMDCYDSEEIKKPSYPVLWAIVGTQEPPVDWGSRTTVEIKFK